MDQNQNIVLDTVLPLVIFNMLFKPKYKDLCFTDWERNAHRDMVICL